MAFGFSLKKIMTRLQAYLCSLAVVKGQRNGQSGRKVTLFLHFSFFLLNAFPNHASYTNNRRQNRSVVKRSGCAEGSMFTDPRLYHKPRS